MGGGHVETTSWSHSSRPRFSPGEKVARDSEKSKKCEEVAKMQHPVLTSYLDSVGSIYTLRVPCEALEAVGRKFVEFRRLKFSRFTYFLISKFVRITVLKIMQKRF